MTQAFVEIQVGTDKKSIFSYTSLSVPRAGEWIALTVDDQGYLMAKITDVIHIPLRCPKLKKVGGIEVLVASAASVLIDTSALDVAAWVNKVVNKNYKGEPQKTL